MAWSILGHSILQGSPGTTAAIDTTGATLLIGCSAWYGGTSSSPSDSKGNTWTTAVQRLGSIGRGNLTIYYCAAPTVGSGHTLTDALPAGCIEFIALSGSAASPHDATNNSSFIGDGTTKTRSPGSVTPGQSGEFCLSAYLIDDDQGSTFSVDSGFTILDSRDVVSGAQFGLVVAEFIQGAAAAVNPTLTRSVAGTSGHEDISLIATFKSSAPPSQTITPSSLYNDTDSVNVLTAATFNTFIAGLVASDETFSAPAVSTIAAALPALFTDSDSISAPTSNAIASVLTALHADSDTIPAATLSAIASILPVLYADDEVFFTANAGAIAEAVLSAGLFSEADAFYAPNIANILQFLRSALLADQDRFYSQRLAGGLPVAAPTGVLTGSVGRRPTLTGSLRH